MGRIGSGNHHDPRSFTVESVNDAGSILFSDLGDAIGMTEEGIHQSAFRGGPWRWVNDHARFLGDHQDVFILIEHFKGNILRQGSDLGWWRGSEADLFVCVQLPGGFFHRLTIDGHQALFDTTSQDRSGMIGVFLCQPTVEAFTGLSLRYRELSGRSVMIGARFIGPRMTGPRTGGIGRRGALSDRSHRSLRILHLLQERDPQRLHPILLPRFELNREVPL